MTRLTRYLSLSIVILVTIVASVQSQTQTCSLVRYKDSIEPIRWGIVEGDQVIALKNSEQYQSTRDLLERGASEVQSLCDYVRSNSGGRVLQLLDLDEITILPPILGTKIISCVANHCNRFSVKSPSSIVGPSYTILKPPEVKLLDYRLNIGLVLSKPIQSKITFQSFKDVAPYVAGFVQVNEFSPRFLQEDSQLPEFTVIGRDLTFLNDESFSRYFQYLPFEIEFQVNSVVHVRKSIQEVEKYLIDMLTTLSFSQKLNAGDVIMIEVSKSKFLSNLPVIGSLADLLHLGQGTPNFFDTLLEFLGSFSFLKSGDVISSRIYSPMEKTLSSGPQNIEIASDPSLIWQNYQQFVNQNSIPGIKWLIFSSLIIGSLSIVLFVGLIVFPKLKSPKVKDE